ncbi:hypothetical protein P4O66_004783, partial [Electrophorus voltai]
WASSGDLSALEILRQKSPELLGWRDELEAVPLHHAAGGGRLAVIRLIVDTVGTEELNAQDEQGRTPLHWAVEKNQHESCMFLLELGADPNILTVALMAPLHLAVSQGHNHLVKLLLSCGRTDVNLEGDLGNTPVMLACSHNNCQALQTLFDYGAKLCHQNKLGHYAIHTVAFAGATDVMEVVLQKGEELGISTATHINYLDKSKSSPLHLAVRGGTMDVIKLCISKGAKVDQQQCDKSTALHFACTQGAIEAVKVMLVPFKSVDEIINIRDAANQTPLHRATLFDHVELAEYLVSKSKAVRELLSEEDSDGCTPLHYACKLGIHNSVQNMLGLNISLSHKSKQKKSALHFAAEYGRVNTCQRLLDTITDSRLLNEGDENGLTPLHLASGGGHTKVVELLLRRGALFQNDYKGWSCLHHATAEGFTKTMEILLAGNIKLMDSTDEEGNTALHIAAREGHVAAVKLLLNSGAQITLSKNDTSFIHEAVRNGRKDVANATIHSERCDEALSLFKRGSGRCVVLDLIEFLPESVKHLLDLSMTESDHDPNSIDYHVTYSFKWLQAPVKFQKFSQTDSSLYIQPLAALNAMVQYKRLDLLTHPVCQKYLGMKWKAYGSKAHLLNLAVYLLGLLPLTYLIINLKPTQNISINSTDVTIEPTSFRTGLTHLLVWTSPDAIQTPAPSSAAEPAQILPILLSELLLPVPEHYAEQVKVAYIISLLTGRPLAWATLVWEHQTDVCSTLAEFAAALKQTFDYTVPRGETVSCLINIRQGKIAVADYTIEFCEKHGDHRSVETFAELRTPLALFMCLTSRGSPDPSQCISDTPAMVPLDEALPTAVIDAFEALQQASVFTKLDLCSTYNLQSCMVSVCIVMVLVMNVYAICKELVQMAQQRLKYFMDSTNMSDWSTAVCSLTFVVPVCFSTEDTWHWQAGALAILFAWINFLLYFQRFERFGIYVVMFGEIIKTLVSVIILFVFLLLAFGLSFHALMLHREEFSSISLSVAQTFVMTVGELNYQSSVLEAYERGLLAFPQITYYVFVMFVLLMPILLMNLMIGLAVGDIAEVQRNAALKRIAMQIDLHTTLEEKLPYWFLKRVDKHCIVLYPNRKCAKLTGMIEQFWNLEEKSKVQPCMAMPSQHCSAPERDVMKQKNRLKEISSVLEKQHTLLKLIIQKMEISTEADEYDGPQDLRVLSRPARAPTQSKWVPLMQALKARR